MLDCKRTINRREEIQTCLDGKAFTVSIYNDNVDSSYTIAIKTGSKQVRVINSLTTIYVIVLTANAENSTINLSTEFEEV